jgi:hypothetical protein
MLANNDICTFVNLFVSSSPSDLCLHQPLTTAYETIIATQTKQYIITAVITYVGHEDSSRFVKITSQVPS